MRIFANCVAAFFILHFVWSYYRSCYRKGYRIDVWHFGLIQTLFVTSVMLPFNRSPLNVFALSPVLVRHTLPYVDEAFLISALGYGCTILGGSLWRLHLGTGIRSGLSDLLNQPGRVALVMLRSPRLLIVTGLVALILMGAVLAFYFSVAGFGFNVESLLLVRPQIRPIAQFAAFLGMTIGSFALSRFEVRRERSMLLLSMVLACVLFFYGGRAFILGLAELPLVVGMMRRRNRLRLSTLFVIVVFAFALSVMMDAVRHHNFALGRVLLNAGMSIAFGNSFSDTRDFAVVLSFWNHAFFFGKTYLAGLIAFIPRAVSPFRDKWGLGVVTATMAGLNPKQHAGLRIGSFGEGYLNFGLPAVILVGLISGIVLRFVDMRVKEAIVHSPGDVRPYSYFFINAFPVLLMNSVAFSMIYTMLVLFFASILVVVVSRYVKLPLG